MVGAQGWRATRTISPGAEVGIDFSVSLVLLACRVSISSLILISLSVPPAQFLDLDLQIGDRLLEIKVVGVHRR